LVRDGSGHRYSLTQIPSNKSHWRLVNQGAITTAYIAIYDRRFFFPMNLGTRFLAAPFVKCCGTDAVFPTEFGDRVIAFCLLENGDDLAV